MTRATIRAASFFVFERVSSTLYQTKPETFSEKRRMYNSMERKKQKFNPINNTTPKVYIHQRHCNENGYNSLNTIKMHSNGLGQPVS